MKRKDLLGEVEYLIRTMPDRAQLHHPEDENFAWLASVTAALEMVDGITFASMGTTAEHVHHQVGDISYDAVNRIILNLYRARRMLVLETQGPSSVAVDGGQVFDYFDEIRKKIESSNEDLLFVDPYLDANFVSRYLAFCRDTVQIRLLTSKKKLDTLAPAIEQFAMQRKNGVELRICDGLHDRYLFVDRRECYQSGASFKDGGRNAPTVISEIVDAFEAMYQTYDKKWEAGQVILSKT